MIATYETRGNLGFSYLTQQPRPSRPDELLQAFAEAKQRHDLRQMQEICSTLERGWSEIPIWQRGYNKISYQRQRLSPYIGFRPGNQEPYYRAYMQVVLDPEFRQLLSQEVQA